MRSDSSNVKCELTNTPRKERKGVSHLILPFLILFSPPCAKRRLQQDALGFRDKAAGSRARRYIQLPDDAI
jgi:hypothetical protein